MTTTRAKWLKWLGPLFILGAVAAFFLVNRLTRPPAPQAAEEWARRTTSDGACSAEFPLAPKRDTADDGDRLEYAREDRGTSCLLAFSDLSEKDAAEPSDVVFALLRAKYVLTRTPAGAPVKLVRDRTIVEGGYEGREYQFAVGDQFVSRIKVFVNGRRVYRVIAVNPPDATLDRDAQRFIDSFRFDKLKP